MNEDDARVGERGGRARTIGVALLVVSALLWAGVLGVPFLPLSGAWKVGVASALAVAGEVAFWGAVLVLGREAVRRYRGYLDPRRWFGGKRR